jgi:hypothetical protein
VAAVVAFAVAVGVGSAGQVSAQTPSVTVFNHSFPGGVPQNTAFACRFPIVFNGFTAGDSAHVVFEGAPPTTPRSGSNVILDRTITLDTSSHSVTYDLRDELFNRFQSGSIGGWLVKLTIQVTRGTATVFSGSAQFNVAGDCIIPPQTTVTTTPNPSDCPASGCTALPPEGFLAAGGTEVKGEQGSYCWNSEGTATCADSIFRDPGTVLSVRQNEQATLRFGTQERPSELTLFRHERQSASQPVFGGVAVPIAVGNPTTFTVDFPEGTSWLVVSSRWTQGSSITFFKVQVLPPQAGPATPTPAVLALTG